MKKVIRVNAKGGEVRHPPGGFYVPRFWAGIISGVLGIVLTGTVGNLIFLNKQAVLTAEHIRIAQSESTTIPGAISRREFQNYQAQVDRELALFRQLIEKDILAIKDGQVGINSKLDAIAKRQ